jgi:1,4-alpha-glucan branching enzyme/maltooligosyltrehalose trehalohydrolase
MSIIKNDIHTMPFGYKLLPEGGVQFNFWAPDIEEAIICITLPDGRYIEEKMQSVKEGWFTLINKNASPGCHYQYKMPDGLLVPDPASRYQPSGVHGPSEIIDPAKFDWGNEIEWKGRPWNEVVLYEVHTGTFTAEGTFEAIKAKLDYLVDTGVTALELMPVNSYPGRKGWGYDGVLLYAPQSTYGKPDELKSLIKAAHEKGLMVFLDVVYNHFGPDGNYLYVYAKSKFFSEKFKTPWGDAINFENQYVRDFFIHNAIYWLEEYHFDGLRLDAIHAIKDPSKPDIVEELGSRVREWFGKDRHIHLVLENDNNESAYLRKPSVSESELYQAQWNDDFHHCVHILTTGEKSGYYEDYTEKVSGKPVSYYAARTLAEGFAYQGEKSPYRDGEIRGQVSKDLNPRAFVNFIQNHDQIGNRAFGERIAMLTSSEANRAAACLYLLAPSIPMLYMGEEWGSTEPFLFFCDFGDDLKDSVRNGRRDEFARFPEFSDPEKRETIPDPFSNNTYTASLVNWKDLDEIEYQEMYSYYKTLLKARKEKIMPLIYQIIPEKPFFKVLNNTAFVVTWPCEQGKTLQVYANFGNKSVDIEEHISGTVIAETLNNPFDTLKNSQQLLPLGVCWILS